MAFLPQSDLTSANQNPLISLGPSRQAFIGDDRHATWCFEGPYFFFKNLNLGSKFNSAFRNRFCTRVWK